MPQTSTGIAASVINAACSVPADGDFVTGAGLKTMADSIENDIASIKSGNVTINGNKTLGGTWDFNNTTTHAAIHVDQAGALVADGTGASINGAWSIGGGYTLTVASTAAISVASGGAITAQSGSTVTCAAGSKVAILGRKTWDRARVALTDADATVKVTDGDRFTIPSSASLRTITLSETGPVPDEGERLTFLAKELLISTTQWQFERPNTNVVAKFNGSSINAIVGTFTWATFEFVSGAWRLAENSGQAYDGTNVCGCLTGVGTFP